MKFRDLKIEEIQKIEEEYNSGKQMQEVQPLLAKHFGVTERTIRLWAKRLGLTGERALDIEVVEPEVVSYDTYEPPYNPPKSESPVMWESSGSRVLVIGDLHCPFDLDGYLEHCKKVYKEYDCDTVVLIGDVIDSHYSSFHPTDPDGLGGKDELDFAIERLRRYYYAFPNAISILGNHCRIVARKAFSAGVPKQWIRSYSEVLQVPTWNFVTEVEIDGVLYFHGEGGTAKTKMKSELQSCVQGHLHTQAYIEWAFSKQSRIFGLQVGTGIDFDSYAFAYAKAGKKPAISCGVVLHGKHPVLIPMDL